MLIVNHLSGFSKGEGTRKLNVSLSSNDTDYDLHADLIANHGWDGVEVIDVTVTIETGVQISATAVGIAAFLVQASWPTNTKISVINKGEITGKGGAGGAGSGGGPGSGGGTGGKALEVLYNGTNFDNTNGEINGGGGGGGGGGAGNTGQDLFISVCSGNCRTAGGAGGAGYGPNTENGGGSPGAQCAVGGCVQSAGGAGGSGGGKGLAGSSGGSGGGPDGFGGGAGGGSGNAVTGNSNINWINTGTRNGGIA